MLLVEMSTKNFFAKTFKDVFENAVDKLGLN